MSIRRRRSSRAGVGPGRWRACRLEQLEARVVLSVAVGSLPLEPPELNNYGPLQDGFPSSSPLAPADTFKLQSRPGSDFTVFLDFDGFISEGTSWNDYYDQDTIISPAYDIDGHPDNFSTTELGRIQDVWKRVVEDFAPFDLNVTTIDPGLEALVDRGGSDTQWGIHVVITEDNFANCRCGGFAFIGSFGSSVSQPTFIFNESLDGVSEAVSHEVGHTLNLSHDGTSSVEYYRGHGTGATGWCPIMGAGYAKEVTTWDDGEYYDTSNGGTNANYGHGPDDLEVFTTTNGFGYATDDHGDTFATATELYVADEDSVSAFGVIGQNTDLDLFSLDVGTGDLSLTVSPLASRPNLDIWAGLYDSSGDLVAQSNSGSVLSASFTGLELSAGRYYLKIDGVSSHAVYDAATDTVKDPSPAPWEQSSPVGYSQYASLGQYTISGTIEPPDSDTFSIEALDTEQPEGDLDTTTAFTFTVTRAGRTGKAATADYSVRAAHPSAPGENYPWRVDAEDFQDGTMPAGTVEFLAGESAKTITINVVGDATFEFDEPFFVVLSNPSAGWGFDTNAAAGTILSDENRLAFAPALPPLTYQPEGNSGTTEFTYTVTRSGDLSVTTTVDWQVTSTGLTDPAGQNDFVGNAFPQGQVTFEAGQESQTVVVPVAGDVNREPDEQFQISLVDPQSTVPVTIHTPFASQLGTILNDDDASVIDMGDAPDLAYGTLMISNGPRHTVSSPILGTLVDVEGDGQPTTYANGDEQDEDGIVFLDPLVPGTTVEIQVTSSAGGGVLDYFIDFDRANGFGNNANEVFSAVLAGGTEILTVDVPKTAVAGHSYARFRLSNDGGLGPHGSAPDGEVEDYAITISEPAPDRDYGDAPDTPYSTLDTSYGASHIASGPRLGTSIDPESDGTPNDTATGDGRDDDGVRFKQLLIAGQTAYVEVTTAAGGVLDYFVDFDGDGTFGNVATESFHMALVAGTQSVPIVVPEDVVAGKTYARFRLSNAGYLAPIGLGFDGEVEDYQLLILPAIETGSTWSEDFDKVTVPGLPNRWASSSTTSAVWVTVAGGSDTAPNRAAVPATSVISENRLFSVPVNIEPGTNALQFRNYYNLETSYDGAVLEISIGDDPPQDILAAGGSFVTGGYAHTIDSNWGNPLAGRRAWSGDSGGFIDTIVMLPPAAIGQTVTFYWVEGTDNGTSDVGWSIDTIQLLGLSGLAFDYGDAADPFPTLSANSGAAHVLNGTVLLGAAVDANDDGLPTADASGDDSDALGDDEDSVTFLSPLVPGETATVSIESTAGLLSAWIDFNDDGDWLDDEEHLLADVALNSGTNLLEFTVPADAAITDLVMARFRLSTQSALWFTGEAPDGEVEDHAVAITSGQTSNTTVVGRHVFYNHSAFDGNDSAADASDDNAIAPDKQALLPGQKATFANYTSYSRGINGIMIDVTTLPDPADLTVADFEFRVGNDSDPAAWPLLDLDPALIGLSVRPGDGLDGSDRVTIIFPDGAVKKTWLQVTVKASPATGLAEPDVHYWGNAVGDSGDSATDTAVNVVDALGVRANPHTLLNPAPIDDSFDFNRDQQVNVQDELVVRANPTTQLTDLNLIDLQ